MKKLNRMNQQKLEFILYHKFIRNIFVFRNK